ncbi:MAG: diacylglycerol kinase family lipid kinase [Treponema sp.]|jgi:YegS/Rv2252/BmrU family lipid kinase|nr:diacylglycerol kinase family lipid kinase [Treponema sp.]
MPDTGKILVIFNPIAGKGKAIQEYPRIERFLKDHHQNYEIILTKGPRDAEDIVRRYAIDENTAVVAAGGDGTCNEVVNGLLARETPLPFAPLFGILPIGRGNDFSFNAQVGEDLERALNMLLERKQVPLDAGFVTGGSFPEGRYFVNGVGMGFDTKVGFEAAKMKIRSGLSYVFGAIITLARFEPAPLLEIQYDDKTITLPSLIVSVMNGRRMGGTFIMAPHAVLNDGTFDICIIKQTATRHRLLQIVLKYPKGQQEEFEETVMSRAVHFHIKALKGGMAAHCDGETVCEDGKELDITCHPQVLRLINP